MSSDSVDFGILHLEVLEHIFSFLCVRDKVSSSLVCKQWLEASKAKVLLKDICIVIDKNPEETIGIFEKSTRNFCCFRFKEVKLGPRSLTFINNIGLKLEFLSFNNCEFHRRDLGPDYLIDKCINLKTFEVINCDALSIIKINFPHLKRLSFTYQCMLNDFLIYILGQTMPNLEALIISRTQIAFHENIVKRFYPKSFKTSTQEAVLERPSMLILSFHAILNFVTTRQTTLKELDLSHTYVSATNLSKLLSIPELRLKKLVLANCGQSSDVIKEISTSQRMINSLDLSMLYYLNDDKLYTICDVLNNVTELILHSAFITDISLLYIFSLEKLRKLDLSQCSKISAYGFFIAAEMCNLSNLRYLNLSNCHVEDQVLMSLLNHTKKLLFLDISYCYISDKCIEAICECNLIETLKMAGCRNVTFDSNIEHMNNLLRLKELSLNGCYNIKNEALQHIMALKKITFLDLSNCKYITDNALKTIVEQNSMIETLYLNECSLLTDEAMHQVAIHLKRLRTLELRSCVNLTDSCINSFVEFAMNLKYLDFSCCPNINEEACKSLKQLHRLKFQNKYVI